MSEVERVSKRAVRSVAHESHGERMREWPCSLVKSISRHLYPKLADSADGWQKFNGGLSSALWRFATASGVVRDSEVDAAFGEKDAGRASTLGGGRKRGVGWTKM